MIPVFYDIRSLANSLTGTQSSKSSYQGESDGSSDFAEIINRFRLMPQQALTSVLEGANGPNALSSTPEIPLDVPNTMKSQCLAPGSAASKIAETGDRFSAMADFRSGYANGLILNVKDLFRLLTAFDSPEVARKMDVPPSDNLTALADFVLLPMSRPGYCLKESILSNISGEFNESFISEPPSKNTAMGFDFSGLEPVKLNEASNCQITELADLMVSAKSEFSEFASVVVILPQSTERRTLTVGELKELMKSYSPEAKITLFITRPSIENATLPSGVNHLAVAARLSNNDLTRHGIWPTAVEISVENKQLQLLNAVQQLGAEPLADSMDSIKDGSRVGSHFPVYKTAAADLLLKEFSYSPTLPNFEKPQAPTAKNIGPSIVANKDCLKVEATRYRMYSPQRTTAKTETFLPKDFLTTEFKSAEYGATINRISLANPQLPENTIRFSGDSIDSATTAQIPSGYDLIHQIKAAIAKIRPGMELSIRIEPPHLGKIKMKISYESGRLDALLKVEKADLKNILENDLLQLKESLNIDSIKIDIDSPDRRNAAESFVDSHQRHFSEKGNHTARTFQDKPSPSFVIKHEKAGGGMWKSNIDILA